MRHNHTTSTSMKRKVMLSSICIAASTRIGCVDGFLASPARLNPISLNKQFVVRSSSSQLNMVFEPSSLMLASPIFSAAFSATPALSPMDPFVEAELFNDAAHVALDLTSFLSHATLTIRFAAVLGRLFVIAGDYAPDHSILPEEVVFQGIMLWIASAGLIKSLAPMVNAKKELTMRDRKCFASLFRGTGMDLVQYQLLRSAAMEWREVEAGTVITTDEMVGVDNHYMYWLYRGEAIILNQGEIIQTVPAKTSHLLGNVTFASASSKKNHQSELPKTTVCAGPVGATLLRVDTSKLKKLMHSDEGLERAIRNLIFYAMQERVAALLTCK